MAELRKFFAPEFIFGEGALKLVGQYAVHYGALKVFLVTDPGVQKVGWASEVEKQLKKSDVEYITFNDVSPNPRAEQVMAGVRQYQAENCDVIIAVGGGSAIDCAKGIGIVISNDHPILEFEGVDNVPLPMPPLICVPTTGGTSADVSQFAIISDRERLIKIAVISKSTVPDISLIDPLTLTTLTPMLAAFTGMDALVHAIEAYVSNASSSFTDIHALEAIRLLSGNLLKMIQQPKEKRFRTQVMKGSLEAGLAFSNASLGAVHAMAHSLGGLLDLPHGECNSMLLPHVVRYNFESAPQRYLEIAKAMNHPIPQGSLDSQKEQIVAHLKQMAVSLGITDTLGDKGVELKDIPKLAEGAMQDPCMATNPRRPRLREIEELYEQSVKG